MPIVTEILGNKVTPVFEGTYQLCQQEAKKKRKEHPRLRYEIRSSLEAIKHRPILKP